MADSSDDCYNNDKDKDFVVRFPNPLAPGSDMSVVEPDKDFGDKARL